MLEMIEVSLGDGTKIYLESCGMYDDSEDLVAPVSGRKIVRKTKEFLMDTFHQA